MQFSGQLPVLVVEFWQPVQCPVHPLSHSLTTGLPERAWPASPQDLASLHLKTCPHCSFHPEGTGLQI